MWRTVRVKHCSDICWLETHISTPIWKSLYSLTLKKKKKKKKKNLEGNTLLLFKICNKYLILSNIKWFFSIPDCLIYYTFNANNKIHLFPFQFYYFLAQVAITAQYYKSYYLIYINFIAMTSCGQVRIKIAPSLWTGCFSYLPAHYI